MSAFQKRESVPSGQAPFDMYSSPQFTFASLTGNTPNKRIRSNQIPNPTRPTSANLPPEMPRYGHLQPAQPDHRTQSAQLEHRTRHSGLHQSIQGKLAGSTSSTISLSSTITSQSGSMPPPTSMPRLSLPASQQISDVKIRDPPPGLGAEDGIIWIDTTRQVKNLNPRIPRQEETLGTTPEMPLDHFPWCGTQCPPSPPRLKSRPLPCNPADFVLEESQFARHGAEYFGMTLSKGDEEGEWSDDLEDEQKLNGIVAFPNASRSFLAYSSLEMDESMCQTPDNWGSAGGRQRCEAMTCSPIYQNISGSPTYGESLCASTPQANSIPRDSHDADLDTSDGEDLSDPLGCLSDEMEEDDEHVFVFSPSQPHLEAEIKDMNHIYI